MRREAQGTEAEMQSRGPRVEQTVPLTAPATRYVRVKRQRRRRSPLRRLLKVILILCSAAIALGLLAIGLLAISIWYQARHDETRPADAVIVMGAAQWNGRPSPIFKARLDHAVQLYRANDAPLIFLTGGTGTGDQFSEAEVGRDYLLEQGIPAAALISVPDGRTSWQSLQQTSPVLKIHSVHTVLMDSDPFHMFRVKRMIDDLGFRGYASPTHTSPIRPGSTLEYHYMARELAAYLAYVFVKE